MALCLQLDLLVSNKRQILIQGCPWAGIGHTNTHTHTDIGPGSAGFAAGLNHREDSMIHIPVLSMDE